MQSGREWSVILNMSEDKAQRAKAPMGFLDLRAAVASVRRRLYSSGVPAWLLEAARANLSRADSVVRSDNQQKPSSNEHPRAITFIIRALQSTDLALFERQTMVSVVGLRNPALASASPTLLEGTGITRWSGRRIDELRYYACIQMVG